MQPNLWYTDAQAAIVKGLLERGEKLQDVSAFFADNAARPAEVKNPEKTGKPIHLHYRTIAPAPPDQLPPREVVDARYTTWKSQELLQRHLAGREATYRRQQSERQAQDCRHQAEREAQHSSEQAETQALLAEFVVFEAKRNQVARQYRSDKPRRAGRSRSPMSPTVNGVAVDGVTVNGVSPPPPETSRPAAVATPPVKPAGRVRDGVRPPPIRQTFNLQLAFDISQVDQVDQAAGLSCQPTPGA